MFYIYCDESGKPPNSDVISVCGYRLLQEDIHGFSVEWMRCMSDWSVPPIHMRGVSHPSEKNGWLGVRKLWGESWETKRDAMLMEFARIVQGSAIVPVGTVISTRGLSKTADPTFDAFKRTILSTVESLSLSTSDPKIGIVVDDDDESSLRYHKWLNEVRKSDIERRIKTICFADDKGYPLLQAADMLAYEARNRGRRPQDAPSERYIALTKTLKHEPKFIGEENEDRL